MGLKQKTFWIEEEIWKKLPATVNKSALVVDYLTKFANGEIDDKPTGPTQNEIKFKRKFYFLKGFSKKLDALMNEMKNTKYATDFEMFIETMTRHGITQEDYQKFKGEIA